MAIPTATFESLHSKVGVQTSSFVVHGDNTIRVENDSLDAGKFLPYAQRAPYNAADKQHISGCLPGTRAKLLSQIRDWADGESSAPICWLSGMAGTGKTSISRTIAEDYDRLDRLGGSFFFSSDRGDLASSNKLITTLAAQLSTRSTELRDLIHSALKEDLNIANLGLSVQWERLIVRPLSKLTNPLPESPLIFVIDALDECSNDLDIRLFVELLTDIHPYTESLRIFVTSRPEPAVRQAFSALDGSTYYDYVLHQVPRDMVDQDISWFLNHNVERIRRECYLDIPWPNTDLINTLVEKSSGLFLYAAIACRFIQDGKVLAQSRLDSLLATENVAFSEPEKKLDIIYKAILNSSIPKEYQPEEGGNFSRYWNRVMGPFLLLKDTLPIVHLKDLLHVSSNEIARLLTGLRSVVDFPENQKGEIRLLHPSFRDFLLDTQRCTHPWFSIDKDQAHLNILENCIRVMAKDLKEDLCDLKSPDIRTTDVPTIKLDIAIPSHLKYACRYWIQHFRDCPPSKDTTKMVLSFLEVYSLNWLEALSLLGYTQEVISMVDQLASAVQDTTLRELVCELRKFLSRNAPAIHNYPLQVYSSGWVFVPSNTTKGNRFPHR